MQLHSILLFASALLFALIHGAPASTIAAFQTRDFSDDQRHFHQIIQLLHNMRGRIGVPFSAMVNVGLEYPMTVEIDPLDLALLPSGYCFSCENCAATLTNSTQSSPFRNTMVELDETQFIMLCAQLDEHGFEWPIMRLCPNQIHVLLWFLAELRTRGGRVAIPKGRILKAPLMEVDKYRCMPRSPQTTCAPMPTGTPRGHVTTMTTMTLSVC